MKSIFEKNIQQELIKRVNSLSAENKPQWGKMNLCQMLKHCTSWDEWTLGINKPVYKQAFIGKLFGKIGLKRITKDDSALDKNTPTTNEFKIRESECDIELEKAKWIRLIEQYQHYNNSDFIHMFFGKMTNEQIGIMAYKHADHHLRQFGA